MGAHIESFIKRSMHVSTRGALPDKLVPGYLYFVEDEGVILLRMEGDEVQYGILEFHDQKTFGTQTPREVVRIIQDGRYLCGGVQSGDTVFLFDI